MHTRTFLKMSLFTIEKQVENEEEERKAAMQQILKRSKGERKEDVDM